MANNKFAVREVVDVSFKAKSPMTLGNRTFKKGEPVIYFDSAKTSSLESQATTVYAQGGRGNPRLVAFEGDKNVTFTFEEALISPESFAILSGANLTEATRVNLHTKERVSVTTEVVEIDGATGEVPVLDLSSVIPQNGQVLTAADESLVGAGGRPLYAEAAVYVMELNEYGEVTDSFKVATEAVSTLPTSKTLMTYAKSSKKDAASFNTTDKFMLVGAYVKDSTLTALDETVGLDPTKTYLVDFYVSQPGTKLNITPGKFAGNFLIEASTLFRRQSDGRDLPAQFTIPNGKIQTNFTFTMASTGDPSTFPFEVEAFPDYLPFDKSCKVLFSLDVADNPIAETSC